MLVKISLKIHVSSQISMTRIDTCVQTKYLPTIFLVQLKGLCIEYSPFQTVTYGLITIFSTLDFEDF